MNSLSYKKSHSYNRVSLSSGSEHGIALDIFDEDIDSSNNGPIGFDNGDSAEVKEEDEENEEEKRVQSNFKSDIVRLREAAAAGGRAEPDQSRSRLSYLRDASRTGSSKQSAMRIRGRKDDSSDGSKTKRGTGMQLNRTLNYWDGLGVVVGIMIGSGIFASPGVALSRAGSPGMTIPNL